MRSWYTDKFGKTADLCLFLNGHHTRLRIRNTIGQIVHCFVYPSWDDALRSLSERGKNWRNDLTGLPLKL